MNTTLIDPIQRASLRRFDGKKEEQFLPALDSALRMTRIYGTRFGVRKEYVWNGRGSACSVRYVATCDIFSDDLVSVCL